MANSGHSLQSPLIINIYQIQIIFFHPSVKFINEFQVISCNIFVK